MSSTELPQVLAALEYARYGLKSHRLHGITEGGQCTCGRVPCPGDARPGKHPSTPHGDKDATDVTRTLWQWFHDEPEHNIAIALEPSGLVDIAPDSPEWLEEFQRRGLPRTATFHSGGGEGHQHYLYRRPDGSPTIRICRQGEFDLLSKGYCVAPPSRHVSGRCYEWTVPPLEFPDGLPDAPAWAVAMLQERAAAQEVVSRNHEARRAAVPGTVGPPVLLAADEAAWWTGAAFWPRKDGGIDRSRTLWRIAAILAWRGCTPATIVGALMDRDLALFDPPKYANRKDSAVRYWEIADKTFATFADERLVLASGWSGARGAQNGAGAGNVCHETGPKPGAAVSENRPNGAHGTHGAQTAPHKGRPERRKVPRRWGAEVKV